MISKANCILTALFLMSALSAKETSIRLTDGQTAILRPVLLRSEFVSRGTLRVLRQNSLKIGFDAHGFPKFKSVINRPLHFWETRIAQTPAYSKWLNREFKDYVIQHPEIFHSETIAAYKKAGTGLSLKNPMLKDGTPLQWHHGYDGYELVASDEHGNIHHFGGNKVWGYKDKVDNIRLNRLIKTRIDDLAKIKKNDNAKLFKYGNAKFHPKTLMDYRKGDFSHNPMLSDGTNTKWIYNKKDGSFKLVTVDGKDVFHNFHKIKIYDNHIAINTARRWGNICALDLLFSQIGLAYSGESDWRPYVVNAAASVSAGTVAWSIESFLVSTFPLLKGGTPLFIKGVAINLGGPASWIASGAYFFVKTAVMAGWKYYQIQAALEVERRCRESERRARIGILNIKAKKNTEMLKSLMGI